MKHLRYTLVLILFTALSAHAQSQEPLPDWALGPFSRPENAQAVIKPRPDTTFDCPLAKQTIHWEKFHTFNPAAVVHGGRIHLLYRAEGGTEGSKITGIGYYTSRLGMAISDDGLKFTTEPKPVFHPDNDVQMRSEWFGGTEDPRIVTSPDGTYFLTYTQYGRAKMSQRSGSDYWGLGIASSKDLRTWTKYGSPFAGTPFERMKIKSASILQEARDGKLVAAKVNGKYWMYFGEHAVNLAHSADLIRWTPLDNGKGKLLEVMKTRSGYFDSSLTECGPPALLTDKGIILIYNGQNRNPQKGGDSSLAGGTYSVGQALFDKNDPAKLITRLDKPFFQPALDWEKTGQYKNGTTFAEGLVLFKDKWFLYYGCADTFVGVATAPVKKGEIHFPPDK